MKIKAVNQNIFVVTFSRNENVNIISDNIIEMKITPFRRTYGVIRPFSVEVQNISEKKAKRILSETRFYDHAIYDTKYNSLSILFDRWE